MAEPTPQLDAAQPTGILLVDKEGGYTSMDVCAIIRGRLRRAGAPKRTKVGHSGTLDPMATGLLVVLTGKATRLSDRFMAESKEYTATIDLAHTSNTDDAEGAVTAVEPARVPTRAELEAVIAERFTGTVMQRPPQFSAMNVGGKRAYDLARDGKMVDLPARPVRIDQFTVTGYTWPLLEVVVGCGKGTYIRSLARDVGAAVGCGGMLTSLRRTRSGGFDVGTARRLSEIPDPLTAADLLPVP